MDTKSFLDHVASRIGSDSRDSYIMRMGYLNSSEQSKQEQQGGVVKQLVEKNAIAQYLLRPVEANFITKTFPSGNPFGRGSDLVSLLDPAIYTPDRLEMVYNSDNIHIPHDKQLCEQLKKDLEFVAVHDSYPGAWSFIGALCDNYEEQMYYMEKSARAGSADGMVAYALHKFGVEKDLDECLKWMRQAAAMDNIHALLFMALSYHYGSVTPLDRDTAYKYYKRCTIIKCEADDWVMVAVACNNLGVMLAEAGYFRTALRYLKKMADIVKQNHDGSFNAALNVVEPFFIERTMTHNLHVVKKLLELDINQRMDQMIVLQPDNRMQSLLTEKGRAFQPIDAVVNQATTEVQRWHPSDSSDLDEDDLRDMVQYEATRHDVVVPKSDDTIVLRSTQLYFQPQFCIPNQSEVIFFETSCHNPINKYLYSKYRIIYRRMQKLGFWLNYPPLTNDILQDDFILNTYIRDNFRNGKFVEPISAFKPITDYKQLRHNLVNREDLPSDCAGFLLYDKATSEAQGRVIYDMTVIPTDEDVDYNVIIEAYLSMLEKIEFEGKQGRFKSVVVKHKSQEPTPTKAHYTIVVEKDYKIFLRNQMGDLKEVKLSVLSKVIYLLYLNHLEGISFKNLVDYRDELWHYYRAISLREPKPSSIDAMVDPTNNSVNEKVSRIKRAIADMIGESSSAIYAISGEKGSVRRVMIDASQLEWNASRYAK